MKHAERARPPVVVAALLLAFALACAPALRADRARESEGPVAGRTEPTPAGVALGTRGAVASAERHATRVGIEILKRGGNAIDAAIAVGFTLAVTHPSSGNIGGGGFMLIRPADGTATSIDYRETAPGAAYADMYLDGDGQLTRDRLLGPRAAGIPGTVAGFGLAHERFGSLPWAVLLEPAIALARDGHVLDERHARTLSSGVERMRQASFDDSARLYSAADGQPLSAGERWLQPELAATLQGIADHGWRWFYESDFSRELAKRVQELGGLWTESDLAGYRAIERAPIAFEYRGYTILSMPPPSAGGIVMRQILAAGELLGSYELPWQSAQEIHLYIEATRRSYADRNYLLGDPSYIDVPLALPMDRDYIAQRMADIDARRATPSSEIAGGAVPAESHDTNHYSVVDGAGNAVANTYTLNTGFGSKVVAPGTGVLLNNQMDDFAAKPGEPNVYGLVQGERNRIEPGKRMLSSMTPTILLKDGALRAVLGTPGGPTITTTVVRIARALIDYDMPLDRAVAAARIHHQWLPDRVIVEPGLAPAVLDDLRSRGHEVIETRRGRIGHANCIEVDPATGMLRAVADVARGGGEAAAY